MIILWTAMLAVGSFLYVVFLRTSIPTPEHPKTAVRVLRTLVTKPNWCKSEGNWRVLLLLKAIAIVLGAIIAILNVSPYEIANCYYRICNVAPGVWVYPLAAFSGTLTSAWVLELILKAIRWVKEGFSEEPLIKSVSATDFVDLIFKMITLQLYLKYPEPEDAFSEIMINKKASGYLFGFHDALMQRYGVVDVNDPNAAIPLLKQSYQNLFGEKPGVALLQSALHAQENAAFIEGRDNGASEILQFIDKKVPAVGLLSYLSL